MGRITKITKTKTRAGIHTNINNNTNKVTVEVKMHHSESEKSALANGFFQSFGKILGNYAAAKVIILTGLLCSGIIGLRSCKQPSNITPPTHGNGGTTIRNS
jgi:hypothetical protein